MTRTAQEIAAQVQADLDEHATPYIDLLRLHDGDHAAVNARMRQDMLDAIGGYWDEVLALDVAGLQHLVRELIDDECEWSDPAVLLEMLGSVDLDADVVAHALHNAE